MAENQEPNQENKNDKNAKPKFNSNWIFAILILSVFGLQFLFQGKATQKAGQREVEKMVINHDIEKVVVVNKDRAEIYIKADSLKSGRYPDFPTSKGFGFQTPKPQFYHTFGTVELFETFFNDVQQKAGYTPDEMIHPEYITRKDYLGTFLSFILPLLVLVVVWVYIMRRMSGGGGGGGAGNIFLS